LQVAEGASLEPKRIRRSKADARRAILDVAHAIFLADGLEAVRVQRVAAAVGVTDAAVHYHFGSHAGLIEALLRHCGRKLVAEISAASAAPERALDLKAVSRAMQHAYVDQGGGRMAVWLKLAGWRPRGSGMLSSLVTSVHAERVAQAKASGAAAPSLEDTKFLVTLLNAVHLAQAVLGDALLTAVDADGDEAGQQRFLNWATRWIVDHMHPTRAKESRSK
jgi:AcrR family transcriptional regulator